MIIQGFKCFKKGLINRYGHKFEVGTIYFAEGAIKFGNSGNGFHMCKNLEDTLRYYDAMHEEVDICEVVGSGKIAESFDEYYGYYDMYAVSKLEILKKLTREEIIANGLNLSELRVGRFITGFKLTEDEIKLFLSKFSDNAFLEIEKLIDYYQRGNLDAFTKKRG